VRKPIRDKHLSTRRHLEIRCNKIDVSTIDWDRASDPTKRYNCFGFALEAAVGKLKWWQAPIIIGNVRGNPGHYWPKEAPFDDSVDSHIIAARLKGFDVCADANWDDSAMKIMLYFTERDRVFKHAARQKAAGVWESKLGTGSDIPHAIDGVDNIEYGTGRVYMQRPLSRPTDDTTDAA
jgi:hypothetical protein